MLSSQSVPFAVNLSGRRTLLPTDSMVALQGFCKSGQWKVMDVLLTSMH